MRAAFGRGVADYLRAEGLPDTAVAREVRYDKLHNAAYDGDPGSATVKNARSAAVEAGLLAPDAPVRGWDVSCDARLFAAESPGMPVITAGIGDLASAHSDDESVRIADLWKAVEFCALFLLRETGSRADAQA
jgi:acetylornithine deacetylase/succinyl-diaminopimelate desuccinylase-like protein